MPPLRVSGLPGVGSGPECNHEFARMNKFPNEEIRLK